MTNLRFIVLLLFLSYLSRRALCSEIGEQPIGGGESSKAPAKPTSDFVIVGAGTAGCALASRLCSSLPSSVKITVLERAPPRNTSQDFLVRSARQFWNAFFSTQVAEVFPSLPDSGLGDRSVQLSTGRTLGGSSAINGMQYVVPVEGTVEKWGIKGLNTESSLPFYKKAFETVGFGAQKSGLRLDYMDEYLEASKKAGLKINANPFETRSLEDTFEDRVSVDKKGVRMDSCRAYLEPIFKSGKCEQNLQLVQGVTVTRVLLEKKGEDGLVATGVEYVRTEDVDMKQKYTIKASKEVLVAAGPFKSPQLLQLSGLGPKEVLEKAGVKQMLSLDVGTKTQARPFVPLTATYNVPLEPSNNSTKVKSAEARKQWESGKGGVLGRSPTGANGRVNKSGYFAFVSGLPDPLLDQSMFMAVCFGNVDSTGYLKITDNSPFSSPEVKANFLQEAVDVQRLKQCLVKAADILKKFPKRFGIQFASPENGTITESFIRENASWGAHFVGGCRVGSVLNEDLTVRGVHKLRVVDASSLSSIPDSAGPLSSVYMLAEYMSQKIAEAYTEKFMPAPPKCACH